MTSNYFLSSLQRSFYWFSLTILLVVAINRVSFADEQDHKLIKKAEAEIEVLKQRYLKLRNTDPKVKQRSEWEAVASDLSRFVGQNTTHPGTPSVLYNIGILNDTMFRALKEDEFRSSALFALDEIAKRYPEDPLADDALMLKGEILEKNDESSKAREVYEMVVAQYPHGDMYDAALKKTGGSRKRSSKENTKSSALDISPSLTPDDPRIQGKVIVLDPGHGGEDLGARGIGGLLEKDITLAVALQLEQLLTSKLELKVFLTRRTDIFVPLADRTRYANERGADLFVSLHTNASPKAKSSGIEVYYLDNTNDRSSRTLAERENSSLALEKGGAGDLQFMLSDLIQNAKLDDSIALAHILEEAVIRELLPSWKGLKMLGIKKAPFFVLVGAHMPCVLVEMFFVDHPEDGKRLAEKTFRTSLAIGLFRGIEDYFKRR